MQSMLARSADRSRAVAERASSGARMMIRQATISSTELLGIQGAGSEVLGGSMFRNQESLRERYGLNHGWLHAAIHAKASRGAGQPVNVARIVQASPNPDEPRSAPNFFKAHASLLQKRMPPSAWQKVANMRSGQDLEILDDHPLLDVLEEPNSIQKRWQFVYTFFANLELTGRAFIVGGKVENDRWEFFSLPTTWVRHDPELAKFWIVDPKDPAGQAGTGPPLTRENVTFAYLPDPMDPRKALSPAEAQTRAARIDDKITNAQDAFFDNSVFPRVIVTMGRNPHPRVPAGVRPRLTRAQRNEVVQAIHNSLASVHTNGAPAIVDGLVEGITRLDAKFDEIGFEKSSPMIRTRLLSAIGIHPFILGEPVSVGGHAQAFSIERITCDRINSPLDMLGNVMTAFAGPKFEPESRLLVWWDRCEALELQQQSNNMRHGLDRGAIDDDEYRAFLGLSPRETPRRPALLDSVGGLTATAQMLSAVGRGEIHPESAAQTLSRFFSEDLEATREWVGATAEAIAAQETTDTLAAVSRSLRQPLMVRVSEVENPMLRQELEDLRGKLEAIDSPGQSGR